MICEQQPSTKQSQIPKQTESTLNFIFWKSIDTEGNESKWKIYFPLVCQATE